MVIRFLDRDTTFLRFPVSIEFTGGKGQQKMYSLQRIVFSFQGIEWGGKLIRREFLVQSN